MTNSIRKMLESKEAKRAHAVQVLYESIHIEPGFNLRLADDALEESIEALTLHILSGGTFPPLEVRIRDAGGVWIVDGHRRYAAIGRALARGADLCDPKDSKVHIHVVIFEGNDADRTARIITSAAGKPLMPMEIAEGYKRLRAFGWTPPHIATKVGKTSEHVLQLLALGDANSDVRQMVSAGKVSATLAAKTARKHGEQAGAVLEQQLESATAQGKTRVTPATVAGPKAKTNELRKDSERLDFLIQNLALVHHGDRGYWAEWGIKERQQTEFYPCPREAIDAAISAKQTNQTQQNQPA
jgi:ParB family chromosome partitioning protein